MVHRECFLSALHHYTYVDEAKGRDTPNCGQTRGQPCQKLRYGIEQTQNGGIVHLIGNQTVHTTISLKKDITITKNEED